MRKFALLIAVAGLSACTVGPDYERPDLELPESALDATLLGDAQEDAMAYWWTRYRDPVLNELIDKALDDNLDVALQAARFREARAQLAVLDAAGAARLSWHRVSRRGGRRRSASRS